MHDRKTTRSGSLGGLVWGLAAASALVVAGCAPDDETDGAAHRDDALLGGTATSAHPEVGQLTTPAPMPGWVYNCTATLVTRDIIVTAAHCVEYGSCDADDCRQADWSFHLTSGGRTYAFGALRYHSWSGSPGEDDIALVELDRDVPASVAQPAPLASADPAAGTGVTIYGYGCQRRADGSGGGYKQRIEYAWGAPTNNLCPGDSGGPTLDPAGRVLRVNSGYYGDDSAGSDVFGNVVARYAELAATIAHWDEGAPESGGGGGGGAGGGGSGAPVNLRAAYVTDDHAWLYVEWDAVAGASQYAVVAYSAAGGPAISYGAYTAGAGDRGPFLYTYVHRDEICRAFASRGLGAGGYVLQVQLWPDPESARLAQRVAAGVLQCP